MKRKEEDPAQTRNEKHNPAQTAEPQPAHGHPFLFSAPGPSHRPKPAQATQPAFSSLPSRVRPSSIFLGPPFFPHGPACPHLPLALQRAFPPLTSDPGPACQRPSLDPAVPHAQRPLCTRSGPARAHSRSHSLRRQRAPLSLHTLSPVALRARHSFPGPAPTRRPISSARSPGRPAPAAASPRACLLTKPARTPPALPLGRLSSSFLSAWPAPFGPAHARAQPARPTPHAAHASPADQRWPACQSPLPPAPSAPRSARIDLAEISGELSLLARPPRSPALPF